MLEKKNGHKAHIYKNTEKSDSKKELGFFQCPLFTGIVSVFSFFN